MKRVYLSNLLELEYDKNNVWHVYPIKDKKLHTFATGKVCACNPKYQVQENKALVIVHNAYDHREWIEKARLLKFKN